MKKIISLISASLFIFLTACNNKPNPIMPTSSTDKSIYVAECFDNYEDGRIIGGFNGSDGTPSKYFDYGTMESTVLCSRPNCKHNTDECIARNIGICPMLVQNSIYFFKSDYGVKEEKNGKRNFYINSKLCRASLETSEIEVVTNFTDCVPADTRGYVFHNNKIYFTADDMNPKCDDYGAFYYSNIGGTHYLCSIDLENGEYKNYGSIYDGDKKFESADSSSSAKIMGIYNEKLIVNYEFSKSYDDLSEGMFTELIFEFNLEKNELIESDIPSKPVFVNSDTIVYYDDSIKKCIIIDNNVKKELDTNKVTFASVHNNKLFIRDDKNEFALIWYNLSDFSKHNVKDMNCYMPVSMHNSSYILTNGDKTIKLTEEELLALDKE